MKETHRALDFSAGAAELIGILNACVPMITAHVPFAADPCNFQFAQLSVMALTPNHDHDPKNKIWRKGLPRRRPCTVPLCCAAVLSPLIPPTHRTAPTSNVCTQWLTCCCWLSPLSLALARPRAGPEGKRRN